MFSTLAIFVVCICVPAFGRPSKHIVEKRWAYIENGDPQMRSIHTDCKKIVREYSDGEMPFYEYKAKMRKCMDRQERTNIPSYDDMDEFTPSFSLPGGSSKRFETPRNFQQQQPEQNYAYNYNNYQYQDQNGYGQVDQRANIATPQQYAAPQPAQAFPSNYNYYPQTQPEQQINTRRSEIPSYPQEDMKPTMYDTTIVKKDEIPRPDGQ